MLESRDYYVFDTLKSSLRIPFQQKTALKNDRGKPE